MSAALSHLSSSGIVLSTERRVSLDTSLTLLMHAEKLKSIKYWGRIQGVAADYHIAQGATGDDFDCKTFYRSVQRSVCVCVCMLLSLYTITYTHTHTHSHTHSL